MKTVDRELFIDWILEDAEDFYARKDLIKKYLKDESMLTAQELFDNTGYIPAELILEDVGEDEEFTPNEDCVLQQVEPKGVIFAFGDLLIDKLENGWFDDAKKLIKQGDGALFVYDENIHNVIDFANEFNGWNNYLEIDAVTYEKLISNEEVVEDDSITSNNRLIAKFMGMSKGKEGDKRWENDFFDKTGYRYKEKELMYNSSWDWLMPVVVEIKDNQVFGTQSYINAIDNVLSCDVTIENTYKACVDFIKHYNTLS